MKKLLMMLLLSLSLIGCSQRLAYNNLGWLAGYYVADYVELSDEQEEALEQDVEALVEWHRNNELPKYKQHINALLNNWQTMEQQDIVAHVKKARELWYTLVAKATPIIEQHLATLSQAQRSELLSNIEAKINEDDWQQGDQYRRYKRWLGDLSESQRSQVDEYFQQGEFSRQVWRAHQQRRLNQFKQSLMLTFEGEVDAELLRQALISSEGQLPPRMRDIQARRIQEYGAFAITLRDSLTEKQQRHFSEELQDIASLLQSL